MPVNGFQKRSRWERVEALELPPGAWERAWHHLHRSEVLLRLGLCALAVLGLWAAIGGWRPALPFRTGYTPPRNIVARTSFDVFDPAKTKDARQQALATVPCVYEQDATSLVQLRTELQQRVVQVVGATSLADLKEGEWDEFFAPIAPDSPPVPAEEKEQRFKAFHEALPDKNAVADLERAVAEAFVPFEDNGLIEALPKEHAAGSRDEVIVQTKGSAATQSKVRVANVLFGRGEALKQALAERVASPEVASRVFDWLRLRLPKILPTLKYQHEETEQRKVEALTQVGDQFVTFKPGEKLVDAGAPLRDVDLELLAIEHRAYYTGWNWLQRLLFGLWTLGMCAALMTLCGVHVAWYERRLVSNVRLLAVMLFVVVGTAFCAMVAADTVKAELLPVLVLAMTLKIAFHAEMALLVGAAMALLVSVATGQGLASFIILTASSAVAVLLLGRVRSRRKLTYLGCAVAVVGGLTAVGVLSIYEQPLWQTALPEAGRVGLLAIIAGAVMTALLPFVEGMFGVQTEISLLELGDMSHPLLQELVRRAPGTYNHSINVAALGEAAAEAIGANGLLVRVGAYFHDIGKMLKPGYFVENQGHDASRHEALMPAMSTLIIIAHIKDGADLARRHGLPQPIIDFIQQHHGTTLVEYFFRRASQQSEADPDRGEVEESAFRYPGPKPQTREAAVLMMADAVEGASRTLVEPTPARIESLVHELAMKRLLDGQFDACDLTLQELATIEESLVKSLSAVYHGRIKYPDQRTA